MPTIQASLTLIGDDFSNEYVSRKLGISPDYIRYKNEPIRNSNRKFPHTEWGIVTERKDSLDISEVTVNIFKIIADNKDIMKYLSEELYSQWNLLIDIDICGEQTPGIVLSSDEINLLSYINAQVGFDIIVKN